MKDKDAEKNTGKSAEKKKSKSELSRSPEKLHEYIRVGSPALYVLVGALVLVVASLLIWGFFGRIPRTLAEYGYMKDNEGGTVCLSLISVETDVGDLKSGSKATLYMADGSKHSATVQDISVVFSADQLRDILKNEYQVSTDWAVNKLLEGGEFFHIVWLIPDDPEQVDQYYGNELVSVSFIIEEIKPISFLIE